MATKKYMGRLNLKSPGAPVEVRVEARDAAEAKRLIEAQYAGQIKSWFNSVQEVK